MNAYRRNELEKNDVKALPLAAFTASVVILAGGALCLAWLKEVRAYHSAMVVDEAFYYENVPVGTLPRFWFHGNFPRYESQMP